MAEHKKRRLTLTHEDVANFRSIQDQLGEHQQNCQNVLAPLLLRHGVNIDAVNHLEFPELTRSLVKRKTDATIMEDDLQRFRLFNAAVRLVTKSTDEPGQELSEQMASLITDITSLMWTVLRRNHVSPPAPLRSGQLENQLNEITKEFLEIIGEENKENAEMTSVEVTFTEVTIEEDFTDNNEEHGSRAVCDVRNYVIVRDLRNLLTRFRKDLGHMIAS